jgi:hypothetical protein
LPETGSITNCGALLYQVRVPLHDRVTGKAPKPHYKTMRGSKKIAQAYMDWYADLVRAGNPPRDVISQTELQDLAHLESKAVAFREKLLGRVSAGGVVQPGPLSLCDQM